MGAAPSRSTPHTLDTPKGQLKGLLISDQQGNPVYYRYTRVPYALPPTGSRRWQPPQALSPDTQFSGNHSSFGPICPQPFYNTRAALVDNPAAAPDPEHEQSEDCLYLNIWVPAGTAPPPNGWPVQFHIHGGWLQVGDANQGADTDPFDLLRVPGSTKRIIVSPTYRLNLFGFLAGQQLAEVAAQQGQHETQYKYNFGLLDQRCALEWTHANIALFNGNPDLITVGGLSAGAHSAFLQLYHDTHLPASNRIIKQCYLFSNAIAIQPNPSTSPILTSQFDSLCAAVNLPPDSLASATTKLDALRLIPAQTLVEAIGKLPYHTFRTSTDNLFVPSDFLSSLHDGSFATLLAQSNIRLVLGEVAHEANLYKLINPPSDHAGLLAQIGNYYPPAVTQRLLSLTDIYDIPPETGAGNSEYNEAKTREKYQSAFAAITADMQVHASIRGLTRSLLSPHTPSQSGTKQGERKILALPRANLLRYRIEHRAPCLDHWIKPSVGVCHAADTPIWWLTGLRAGYSEKDTRDVLHFLEPFGVFLSGDGGAEGFGCRDGSRDEKAIDRVFRADGTVDVNVKDELWEKGCRVWDAVWEVQK